MVSAPLSRVWLPKMVTNSTRKITGNTRVKKVAGGSRTKARILEAGLVQEQAGAVHATDPAVSSR